MASHFLDRISRGRGVATLAAALLIGALGQVIALRSAVAPLAWTVPVGRAPSALALDPRTARVFVADSDAASVTMLDAHSGAVLRTIPVGADPSALAVDVRTNRVFVVNATFAGTRGSVSVLNASTGDLLRTVSVGAGPQAVAADERSGHVVVANSGADSVCLLDARSGRVLRTVTVGTSPSAVAVDARTEHAFVVSAFYPPRPGRSGTVSVLDTRTGALLRTVAVGQWPGAVTVDSRHGHVIVTNAGSRSVSALDAQSGALLWTAPVGRDPTSAAVDEASGHVFVPSGVDGTVSVLSIRTGALLWTVPVGIPTGAEAAGLGLSAVAMDERRGRALVLRGDQASVGLLDGRSGVVLRTVAVGVHPLAVAIDAGADRAFVLDFGGVAPPSTAWWDRAVAGLGHWLPWLAQRTPARAGVPASVSVLVLGRL